LADSRERVYCGRHCDVGSADGTRRELGHAAQDTFVPAPGREMEKPFKSGVGVHAGQCWVCPACCLVVAGVSRACPPICFLSSSHACRACRRAGRRSATVICVKALRVGVQRAMSFAFGKLSLEQDPMHCFRVLPPMVRRLTR
jgi:hypothetical protein